VFHVTYYLIHHFNLLLEVHRNLEVNTEINGHDFGVYVRSLVPVNCEAQLKRQFMLTSCFRIILCPSGETGRISYSCSVNIRYVSFSNKNHKMVKIAQEFFI
jgi:hypothetical protein